MTIEEKAKAYDEALELMRDCEPDENGYVHVWPEDIFSELKVSNDERIRKELIDFVKSRLAGFPDCKRFTDWLEKQGEQKRIDKIQLGKKYKCIASPRYPTFMLGNIYKPEDKFLCSLMNFCSDCFESIEDCEQKPTDKVEPKFKVGDSISKKHNSDINKFGIFTITSIADNKYWYNDSVVCDFSDQDLWELVECPKFKKGDWVFHNTAEFIYMIQTIGRDGYGVISRDGKKSVVYYSAEINYRLWTIQDAKDGDVLHCWIDGDEFVLIYKGIKDGYITTYGHLYQRFKLFAEEPTTMFCRAIQGYFTPATKEQRDALMKVMADAGYTFDFEKKELKRIEQKPAWSEEDRDYYDAIIAKLEVTQDDALLTDNQMEFLKSLRPQNRRKPSEEQIKVCKEVYADILFAKDFDLGTVIGELNRLEEELKKLKG